MNINKTANTWVVASELSHIFCCGLPMLIAVFSSSTQLGWAGGIVFFHEALHDYEAPILITSGLLLLFGLALQYFSFRIDCRETGYFHDNFKPKKLQVSTMFKLALVMYAVNLAIFFLADHGVG